MSRKPKITGRRKKTNEAIIRALRALPWTTIEDVIGAVDEPKADKNLSLRISENMIATRCEIGLHTIRWTIEIAGMVHWKEDHLRLDFAHPSCFEMEGRPLREVIDHPAFDDLIIASVAPTPFANRRSGVVMSFKKPTSILTREGWAEDPSMRVPARINEHYASIRPIKAAPILASILQAEGVRPDAIQKSYEEAGQGPYPTQRLEILSIPHDELPLWLANMSAQVTRGVMTTKDLPVAMVGGKPIMLETSERHAVVRIPYDGPMPEVLLASLSGRRLGDVVSPWKYANPSISSAEIEESMLERHLIVRIEEEPVELMECEASVDFSHREHDGTFSFAGGETFSDIGRLVGLTHAFPIDRPAENWSDHLDVSVVSIGSRNARSLALRMRQKGLKDRFSKRRGFAVVGDGWWICPLELLEYAEWKRIASGSSTIRHGNEIFSRANTLASYGLGGGFRDKIGRTPRLAINASREGHVPDRQDVIAVFAQIESNAPMPGDEVIDRIVAIGRSYALDVHHVPEVIEHHLPEIKLRDAHTQKILKMRGDEDKNQEFVEITAKGSADRLTELLDDLHSHVEKIACANWMRLIAHAIDEGDMDAGVRLIRRTRIFMPFLLPGSRIVLNTALSRYDPMVKA